MQSDSPNDNMLSVKPAGWYWRKALREAQTKEETEELVEKLIEELEFLKEVCRDNSIIPPRRFQPHQIVDDPRQGLLVYNEPSVSAFPGSPDSQ